MVVIVIVLRSISVGIAALVLPLYFDSIGRSAGEWGLASAAFAFTLIFAEPLWGWASDRLGIAVPFLVAGLGSALLAPALALTGHLGILLAIQAVRGIVEFASSPGARKALAHSLGPSRKAVGIGLFQACGSAGGALGPLLGGLALGYWGYPGAFLACAAVSLLAALVTWANRGRLTALMRTQAPASATNPLPAAERTNNRSLGVFAALAFIGACLYAGNYVSKTFVPLLGTAVHNLQTWQVAVILAVTGVLAGPFTIVTGRLADLWGRRPLIVGGLLCVGAGLLGYAVLGGFAGLAASTVVLALGFAAGIPASVALISDVTPYARQGRMLGLYGAGENIGIMLGPLLCGFLWDAASYRVAFLACALIPAFGLVASLCLRQRQRAAGPGA